VMGWRHYSVTPLLHCLLRALRSLIADVRTREKPTGAPLW
jgi:hypothetical protein